MKITREFKLLRIAQSIGGDRYEEIYNPDEAPMMKSTYVLQSVSRASGSIAKKIRITIETEVD